MCRTLQSRKPQLRRLGVQIDAPTTDLRRYEHPQSVQLRVYGILTVPTTCALAPGPRGSATGDLTSALQHYSFFSSGIPLQSTPQPHTTARAMVKVGINGFGRIGRLAFRLAYDHPELEFVHINESPGSGDSCAYLAKYDSIHGTWRHGCAFVDGSLEVTSAETGTVRRISYSSESTPGAVDWAGHGVELVLECSGEFLTRQSLAPYFERGVKRVLVSAPVKDATEPVLNVVYGVNHLAYDKAKDKIITAASCTTNCLAPVVQVVQQKLGGIKRGSITTIHNVTNTQTIVDAPNAKKNDLRRYATRGSQAPTSDCLPIVQSNYCLLHHTPQSRLFGPIMLSRLFTLPNPPIHCTCTLKTDTFFVPCQSAFGDDQPRADVHRQRHRHRVDFSRAQRETQRPRRARASFKRLAHGLRVRTERGAHGGGS